MRLQVGETERIYCPAHRGFEGFVSATVLCAGLVLATPGLVAQESAPQQDLQGILPEFVPLGIGEGDFEQLGGNWEEWGIETGRLVTDFYASDDAQVRGRASTLQEIQNRVRTMQRALSDSRYLSIYGPLADLNGRLSRRADVAQALLQTVQQDVTAPPQAQTSTAMNRLGAATQSARSYLQSVRGGELWFDYLQLDAIEQAARQPAGPEAASVVASVDARLKEQSAFNAEQQEFLNRQPLRQFESAVHRAAVVLQAGAPEERAQQLRDLAGSLMEAIEQYEETPTGQTMQTLRRTFDDFRAIVPGGAPALSAAMRRHYLNYNLRVVVDESLLRDIARDHQSDSGFINEMVSRARIQGCQWTNATVNLDLVPNPNRIAFDLILEGNVRSSITGSTHMATVQTAGQYHFHGRKSVLFDGERFVASPAQVGVTGSNTPYAASTRLNWIPILRRVARNAALREAGSAENNQYARNKVYQEARSQFDREAAQMLWEAEGQLQSDVIGPLRREGYYPDVRQLHSTSTEAHLRTRLMESGELGGGAPPALPIYPAHGALVQLHESLLNQVGARLNLEGRRFTPEQLEDYLRAELEQFTQEPIELGGLTRQDPESDSPAVEEILFHTEDALRFRITGGEVILHLNLGLKLEDREEIEPQQITVPLAFTLEGNQIQMERGTIGVSPLGPVAPAERTQQIARAGVMRQKIQEAFEPQTFDGWIDLSLQDKNVRLYITDLRAHGGWLSLIARNGVSGPAIYPGGAPFQPLQQASVTY